MSRRIDIELTSRRDDGTWTWRAPGARQPKGSVSGDLVPEGSNVGDVLRADADFDIEGIVVTAVLGSRAHARADGIDRIEVVGSGRDRGAAGVSVVLAPGSRRRPDDDGGPRNRRSRAGRGESDGRIGRPPRDGEPRERGGRRPAADGGRTTSFEPGTRPTRRDRPARPDDAVRGDRRAGASRTARVERERPRRLQTVSTHRNAALAALRPEQLPVAEQLLRGGIPAVRHAIEEQNTRARSDGRPEVSPEPLLKMAEDLLPGMNLAAWKDRAAAVRNAGNDAPLREMRSVVSAASTVTLDDEARTLAGELRQGLEARVKALRESWLARITDALDAGRVADALRVSSRPPEPAARVPADVAVRLAEEAGKAMSPDVPQPEWAELLAAVVISPVRRTVKPTGLPADAGEDLLAAARRAAGQVPEVARLLGLPIPPPPGPRRPATSAARSA
jgi:hypothetical protein